MCPWNVPVLIREGTFRALRDQHARLNVSVDCKSAFFCEHLAGPEERRLGFCDLQTNWGAHVKGRLGSGRAVFWEGYYLKGIGRTPLAANWHLMDYGHSSGHMHPSSAIREYCASSYLHDAGCSHTIVPCEGILLSTRCHDCHLAGVEARSDVRQRAVSEVDALLNAMSVKPGGFARMSNFVWLLHHLTPEHIDNGHTSLSLFGNLLARALHPATPTNADTTPEALVNAFVSAVRVGTRNFAIWSDLGVSWGSYHNNLTIDGRFLDLETAAITTAPILGALICSESEVCNIDIEYGGCGLWGSEVARYLGQVEMFCCVLLRTLRDLPSAFSASEREYGEEIAHMIEDVVLRGHILEDCYSDTITAVIEGIQRKYELSDTQGLHLRELYPPASRDARLQKRRVSLRRLKTAGTIEVEPGRQASYFVLDQLAGKPLSERLHLSSQGQELGKRIAGITTVSDIDVIFDRLSNLNFVDLLPL